MRGTRGIVATLLAITCALTVGARADAAQYKVSACGAGASFKNHLLTASVSDPRMSAYTACPNDGSGHQVGVTVLAGIDRGTVPIFANALQSFIAPAGTSISRVHLKAAGRTWNGDWSSLLQASNDRFTSSFRNLAGCSGNAGSANGCVSALDNVDQNYDVAGATGIRAVVSCGHIGGCTTFSTDVWPFTRSYYFIRDFDVTLDDLSAPDVSITGGALASGNWAHSTRGITYRATDNSGIRHTQVSLDGTVMADDERGCDYTFAVPCSDVPTGQFEFDTSTVSDGVHTLSVKAVDATNANSGRVDRTIFIDNHAPLEPIGPSVVGGEDWHSVDGFSVEWTNPPSAAPVDKAFYELCKSDGSGCVTGGQPGVDITRLTNLRVGQPGDYTIRVWLGDAAGNDSTARSAPLHLKFDNVEPAQAAPQHRNGWVSTSEAKSFDQQIDPPAVGQPPISGIAGYAVTSDGSTPGSSINTPAGEGGYVGHHELENLPEGVTTVRARAISGSGVPSPVVGSTDLHVDLTHPDLTITGQPDPNRWTRVPTTLRLTAVESGLSGMATGPDDRGVESGGYVEYSIDRGSPERIPGPQRDLKPDGILDFAGTAFVDVPVTIDGTHAVSYRAVDVAGNETPERSVHFKIDQTPPELAVFEAQQQSDPQLITVAASDRTSGLADGGEIQLRRIEPTRGSWIALRTTRQDDRYYARVENASLPPGDYEFRATIPDQAGNEAVAVNDREGHEEVLYISPTQVGPYLTPSAGGSVPSSGSNPQDTRATVDTVIAAAAVQRTVAPKQCKRRTRRGKNPTSCPKTCKKSANPSSAKKCPRVTESLVHDLRVGFGKKATIRGRLTTAAGTPIANAEITVLARPSMAGGTYSAKASVRTGAAGKFGYTAPAGSSRALDFHFRGDDTYKHADDQVTLRVPAAVTIKAGRHSVKNGRSVRFSGKLRGRPYPAKGKILDLQAYYRHRWRTFATPRAALSGKWAYRYRFGATRGKVLYRFRIRVRPTSDYPYELGYSKVTNVRVFGR